MRHLVLHCPLYNPITMKFQLLFEMAILGNLKFIFQSNQQVDISLYLIEANALCHHNNVVGLHV